MTANDPVSEAKPAPVLVPPPEKLLSFVAEASTLHPSLRRSIGPATLTAKFQDLAGGVACSPPLFGRYPGYPEDPNDELSLARCIDRLVGAVRGETILEFLVPAR
jgi:hypothetical protein